jgi:hypothetical protein
MAVIVLHPQMRDAGFVLMVVGLSIGVGALVVLHLVPSDLSPLRNAVSQYGISRYRLGYWVQTHGYALAGFGAAIGISALSGHNTVEVALCVTFGISRALINWFPMDEPGTEPTMTGRRHGLLAFIAFGSVFVATLRFSSVVNDAVGPTSLKSASAVVAILMLVSFFAMGANRRGGGGYFGLAERGF